MFVVGDALTVGAKTDIEAAYADRGVEVTVAAGRGYHGSDALDVLDRPRAEAAKTWVVALGANDDPAQLRAAAAKVLQRAREQAGGVDQRCPPGRPGPDQPGAEPVGRAAKALRVVDFAALAAARPDSFTADGVHTTPAGYRWLAQLYLGAGGSGFRVFRRPRLRGRIGRVDVAHRPQRPAASRHSLAHATQRHSTGRLRGGRLAGDQDMSPSWRPSDTVIRTTRRARRWTS